MDGAAHLPRRHRTACRPRSAGWRFRAHTDGYVMGVGSAGCLVSRPGAAIAQSAKQKTARWVGETPIREVFVGNGQGQVALGSLTRTIKKYPKVLRPAEVTELRRKLDAAAGGSLPIPKGPMPKGLRVPRR